MPFCLGNDCTSSADVNTADQAPRLCALQGILSGCFVVSQAWAQDSMAAGQWLEEAPYLLPVRMVEGGGRE